MEVRKVLWLVSGVLIIPLLIATPLQAQNVSHASGEQQLAGPVGKSSSASARVTLVIPPRPKPKQIQTVAEQKTVKAPVKKTPKKNNTELKRE